MPTAQVKHVLPMVWRQSFPVCYNAQSVREEVAGNPTSLKIEEVALGASHMKVFAHLPWRLYRHDLCWTPPLRGDLLGNRLLGLVGLLNRPHPYHRHAEVTHLLAWRDRRPVGRVSAAINERFNT